MLRSFASSYTIRPRGPLKADVLAELSPVGHTVSCVRGPIQMNKRVGCHVCFNDQPQRKSCKFVKHKPSLISEDRCDVLGRLLSVVGWPSVALKSLIGCLPLRALLELSRRAITEHALKITH